MGNDGTAGVVATEHTFEGAVFPKEIEDIQKRRRLVGQEPVPVPKGAPVPSARLGLNGLALSGGGIRSAAFSLGVVQALAERGHLARTDYLSTVSGGGYLGAALSHLLNGADEAHSTAPEAFPLRMGSGSAEPPALRHLRNSSNYLRPGGAFDALAMPAVYLRGLLLTAVSWLPALLLCVIATSVIYELVIPTVEHQGLVVSSAPSHIPFLFGNATLAVLVAVYPFLRRVGSPLPQRERLEKAIRITLGLTVASVVVLPVWWLVDEAVSHTSAQVRAAFVEVRDAAWLFVVKERISLQIAALIAGGLVLIAARSRAGRSAARSLALAGVGLLAPVVMFGLYLALCVTEVGSHSVVVDGRRVVAGLSRDVADGERAATVELGELLAAHGQEHEGPFNVIPAPPLFWSTSDTFAWFVTFAEGEFAGDVAGFLILQGTDLHVRLPGGLTGRGGWILIGSVLALLLINARFLNVNLISPHGFYRDRLSRVFLADPAGGSAHGDALKLSELGGGSDERGSYAPYHLINATMNLDGSDDAGLRGRQGDFLLFSKHFVGCDHTGWCATRDLERVDGALNLGTAMAISGGVANPAMGSVGIPAIAGLMTLLNLRMGYWLPNPREIRAGAADRRRFAVTPGPSYLRREALRQLNAEHAYVNASDGGHIENTGIYELLRRRCAFIVAVDGEEDPTLSMGSLATALRYARIDLGIDVDIPLDGIRPPSGGPSTSHYAIGRIRYSASEEGTLVYLKASLTGDEGLGIRTYASANPTFPHESTADQFFSEEQFEAYRALGEHIARSVERLNNGS